MAVFKRILSGQTSLAATNTSTAVTVPTVDPNKCIVVLSGLRSTGGDPTNTFVGHTLSATTLTLLRSGTPAAATINWYIIEFESGVYVQRLTGTALSATPTNFTISAVDTSKTWLLATRHTTGGTFNNNDFWRKRITTATNVQFDAQAADAGSTVDTLQVISYDGCVVTDVSDTFASGSTTLNTSVAAQDLTATLLTQTYRIDANQNMPAGMCVYAYLSTSTNLLWTRNDTFAPAALNQLVHAFLVQFNDRTRVQTVTGSMDSATTSENLAISPVETTRAAPVPTGLDDGVWGTSAGTSATDYSSALLAHSITSPTVVNTQRADTDSVAMTYAVQVAEWQVTRKSDFFLAF